MPEKHLSDSEASQFYFWLGGNSTPLHRGILGASAFSVGKTGEPIFIKPTEPNELECDVHYPTGLEEELSESGVIFEKAKLPPPISGGHREAVNN